MLEKYLTDNVKTEQMLYISFDLNLYLLFAASKDKHPLEKKGHFLYNFYITEQNYDSEEEKISSC